MFGLRRRDGDGYETIAGFALGSNGEPSPTILYIPRSSAASTSASTLLISKPIPGATNSSPTTRPTTSAPTSANPTNPQDFPTSTSRQALQTTVKPPAASSSLTKGAKAGIGVGVPIAVFSIVLIIVLRNRILTFFKRHFEIVDSPRDAKAPVHEIEDTSRGKGQLGTWTRAELDGTSNPKPETHELEAQDLGTSAKQRQSKEGTNAVSTSSDTRNKHTASEKIFEDVASDARTSTLLNDMTPRSVGD